MTVFHLLMEKVSETDTKTVYTYRDHIDHDPEEGIGLVEVCKLSGAILRHHPLPYDTRGYFSCVRYRVGKCFEAGVWPPSVRHIS